MNATTAAHRSPLGSAHASRTSPLSVAAIPPHDIDAELDIDVDPPMPSISPELFRAIAEVKGQAQFLLYLADQIEDSLDQLINEAEGSQGSFLCKILAMYSAQLETKHQGLGDRIAETCQEVYVTVREYDTAL